MDLRINSVTADESSDKVNLRELILKRLSAAQEQKLKSTQSVSMSPELEMNTVSTITPRMSLMPNVDEERQLLLTMLEKTQNITNQNLLNFAQERRSFESQLESLNLQNSSLKSELENYKKFSKPEIAHHQFIEELKNLEKISDQREKKYLEEIDNLKRALSDAKLFSTIDKRSSFCYSNDGDRSPSILSKRLVECEAQIENLRNIIVQKDKDLKKHEEKLAWAPKDEFSITIRGNAELIASNDKLERNLKRLIHMSGEREAILTEENERLRNINIQMTEISQNRESELNLQIGLLHKNLTQLQATLMCNEENYSKEHKL